MSVFKSKFISEAVIVPKLIKETEFLNDPSISINAKKIIDACRENKKERTKLDAFLPVFEKEEVLRFNKPKTIINTLMSLVFRAEGWGTGAAIDVDCNLGVAIASTTRITAQQN